MAIEWTEDLATGVPEIDAQHKELFSRINRLLEACNQGQGRAEVGKTLAFLEEYVLIHFSTEEKIMTEKITKLQRWLDLIAFLIGRRYPVSVDQIMEAVPAYAEGRGDDPTAVESVRRMFERDKKELRDLGIPI